MLFCNIDLKIKPSFFDVSSQPENRNHQNNKEDEPLSMLDLVRQLETKLTPENNSENVSPNQEYTSLNVSFSSDGIDLEIQTEADTELQRLESMDEEEFKSHIESVLLPNINLDTRLALSPSQLDTKEEPKSLADYIKIIKIDSLKAENTFVVNEELGFNLQDIVAVEIKPSPVYLYGNDSEDDE